MASLRDEQNYHSATPVNTSSETLGDDRGHPVKFLLPAQEKIREDPIKKGQKKKIIVCCDGTHKNEVLLGPLSNVSRISRCITPVDKDGVQQVVYYQPGLGTDPEKRRLWTNKYKEVIGEGIDETIREAYSFICHNYTQPDDEIYLFGYSRGAFTARCVAQLINDVGLLTKAGLLNLLLLYSVWAGQGDLEYFKKLLAGNVLRKNIRIRACAVWDTVGSIGVPRGAMFSQPPPEHLNFVNSELCPNIDNAFQALALHEHRRHYRPILWKSTNAAQNLKQCWFLGYHGDVGGGRKDGALAHFALVWMIDQLKDCLDFDVNGLWIPPKLEQKRGQDIRHIRDLWGTWEFNQRSEKRTKKAIIKDSMKNVHLLGGDHLREPCRYFWDKNGMRSSPPNAEISNEKLHFSVRILLQSPMISTISVPSCLEVSKCEPVSGVQWTIESRDGSGDTYFMKEEKATAYELNLLHTWLFSETSNLSNDMDRSATRDMIRTAMPESLTKLMTRNLSWTSARYIEKQTHKDHIDNGFLRLFKKV